MESRDIIDPKQRETKRESFKQLWSDIYKWSTFSKISVPKGEFRVNSCETGVNSHKTSMLSSKFMKLSRLGGRS